MAVTTQYSNEYIKVFRTQPPSLLETSEMTGKMRVMKFSHTQLGAGDAGSSITIGKLPAGNVRVLAALSNVYANWTTAAATMDVGYAAYTDPDGDAVAADSAGIADGINVDTAGVFNLLSDDAGGVLTTTAGIIEFNSRDGVDLVITSADAALADGDTMHGYIVYVTD